MRRAARARCGAVAVLLVGLTTGGVGCGADARGAPSDWTWTGIGAPNGLWADDRDVVVVSGNQQVAALAAATGRVRWEAHVPGLAPADPAVDATTVLLAATDRVVALERATGSLRWTAPAPDISPPGPVGLAPSPRGTVALVTAAEGAFTALDAVSGSPRWTIAGAGVLRSPPAPHPASGLVVVVWHHRDGSRVRGVDAASGVTRWEATVAPRASAPAVAGDVVVIGSGDGAYRASVHGFGALDGTERWRVPVPASFEPGLVPVARGETVVVADRFGTITALAVPTGTVRWQTPLRAAMLRARPAVSASGVVVGTDGGALVTLDEADGRVRRRQTAGGYAVGTAASGPRVIVALRLAPTPRVDARLA